jgi:pantoate--beta-alanine ligase
MFTETTIAGIRARLADTRANGARIALVPTMGALHDGHLGLVDAARKIADVVVASIFVNPLQFGPNEDFARYPRSLDSDVAALTAHETSFLFAPAASEMYVAGSSTTVLPRSFAELFEGAVRPGHFAGVLTVVAKLFNTIQPTAAVFGRKDLQQLALIKGMVADLNFPIEIQGMETVREEDGLALSSRNRYLDDQSRKLAPRIRAALIAAKLAFAAGATDPLAIEAAGRAVLGDELSPAVDYFSVVNESNFSIPSVVAHGDSVVAAVRVGGTRLIDNIQL